MLCYTILYYTSSMYTGLIPTWYAQALFTGGGQYLETTNIQKLTGQIFHWPD